MEASPSYGATDGYLPSALAAQYQLMTHTSGGALDFQDQLNDQNLVSLDGNYTTAGVIRFNNTSAYAGCLSSCSPIGYMSGGSTCRDAHSGKPVPCLALALSGSQASTEYYNAKTGQYINPSAVYGGPSGSCDTGKGSAPCGWVSDAQSGPCPGGATTGSNTACAATNGTLDSLWA